MTQRERVLATINHQQPDAVPVDIGSTPSSGISVIAYNNLRPHLSVELGPTRVYDVVQQLAQPHEAFLDYFDIAAVDIGREFNTQPGDWYDIQVSDGSSAQYPTWFRPQRDAGGAWNAYHADGTRIATMPSGATFFDQTIFPYLDGYPDSYRDLPAAMSKVLWSALVHSPWDNAVRPDFWQQLRARALALRARSDRALMIVVGCNLFEWGTFLRRMDNFLMDLYSDPDAVAGLVEALMAIHLDTLDKVCTAVGDVADVIRFGDDLGMDGGSFMPPEIYRALFKPHHRRLCDFVHSHSKMHTFLHSCGSISELLPDLIDAGFEIINPVQTNVRNMDAAYLKREFGADLTFWGGGADTRNVLNNGTPQQVTTHVLERLELLNHGGGFVFATIHNIMPDVPPQNIEAMFAAIRQYNGQ